MKKHKINQLLTTFKFKMKTKIISFGALLVCSIMFAQVPYPHISPSNGSAERGAKFGASDSTNDFLEIVNSTDHSGKYIPAIWAHQQSDNRYALMMFGTTNSTLDNGTVPLMVFRSELRNSLALNAPTGSVFPWGESGTPVLNRPLFSWQNGSTIKMLLSAGGNLGINTTTPSAILHSNGTVRFENIPTATTNTYVLTADASGNVSRQLATSLGGGVVNNCTTVNYLTKKDATGITCSQIIDNGTNIGIGTATPAYKLDVNGTIRCTDLTTLSDGKYKKNVKSVNDALSSILKLEGKTYDWKREEFKDINFNDKLQYGLIAQEVEKVMPALAYKTENGEYSINYIGLIPVLIEAVKQQQTQIIALQDQISSNFQKQNADLVSLKNTKIINVSPNPSSDVITVSLNIEESVQDAKLIVYNLNGNIMSSLNIKERANDITKSLQKDNFGSGTYIISLFVNGKSLDTKKIIFD